MLIFKFNYQNQINKSIKFDKKKWKISLKEFIMDKEVKKHNQKSILLLYNVIYQRIYIQLWPIIYFIIKKILTYPFNLFMFLVRF